LSCIGDGILSFARPIEIIGNKKMPLPSHLFSPVHHFILAPTKEAKTAERNTKTKANRFLCRKRYLSWLFYTVELLPEITAKEVAWRTSNSTTTNTTMSEESKTSDSDYVHMNDGATSKATIPSVLTNDDPSLSQEDRDLRLAIALQQQENAAVYDAHKKRHEANIAANTNRTSRSNVQTRLAQVRKQDRGMLTVPDEYTTENAYKKGDISTYAAADLSKIKLNAASPEEAADLKLALELQKMEQTGAGTARTMEKILTEEKEDEEANDLRNARSGKASFHPTRVKK
jgi:hypothetical protein